MILLDTHIWYWWVADHVRLIQRYREIIRDAGRNGIAISVISCWEVAKSVENGRLELSASVDEWSSPHNCRSRFIGIRRIR